MDQSHETELADISGWSLVQACSLDLREVPASTLAYIGDAIYELYVRRLVMGHGKAKSGALHSRAIHYSQASWQADAASRLSGLLDEEEAAVLSRGRNSAPGAMAKNQSPQAYRLATGLETLVGWLYLNRRFSRLDYIMEVVLNEQ